MLIISELVENLKMMADDNSGKGSPGLFTGEDERINIAFKSELLAFWRSESGYPETLSSTTRHPKCRWIGWHGWYEQKQLRRCSPAQSLPQL